MNKCILIGRLTDEPNVKETQNGNGETSKMVRYVLAVDRRYKKEGQPTADFIRCIAFGKAAEFADKYLQKGTKIAVTGRIQTGSYTNQQGQKIYTTDVFIDDQEFVESRKAQDEQRQEEAPRQAPPSGPAPDFMDIPDDALSELPFH